jgi:hypothetical protein
VVSTSRAPGSAPICTYLAIARLPWLHALAAWRTCGTWTSGAHFVADRARRLAPPDAGDSAPCYRRLGLALTSATTFAVERRRGWVETADTPARAASDVWDERRGDQVTLQKPQPGHASRRLLVSGRYAAFRSGQPGAIRYALVERGARIVLADVQWADWDAGGRLLVATTAGRLQVRELGRVRERVRCDADLAGMTPAPAPPPREALAW